MEKQSDQSAINELEIPGSELWFRTLADAIPQIVWSCSAEGDCNFVNRSWCEFAGVPYEQLLGSGWFECVHPEDRERILSIWLTAIGQRSVYDVESRIRARDGSYRWFKTHAAPVFGEGQQVVRWIGTGADIHNEKIAREELESVLEFRDSEIVQRKQLEEQLRQSERRMYAVLDGTMASYIGMDSSGAIIDWNKEAERCFGWARQEVLGRQLSETIVPERFRRVHGQGIRAILEDQEGRLISRRVEMTALRRDGHEFPVDMELLAVHEADSHLFAAFISDISERKQAERRLDLQHAVTAVLAQSDALVEAMRKILKCICEMEGWSWGALWTIGKGGKSLTCVQSYFAEKEQLEDFDAYMKQLEYKPGEDLAGRVWQSERTIIVKEISKDAQFSQAAACRAQGFQSAMGFPLVVRGQAVGCMEFIGHQLLNSDERLSVLFDSLGSSIGQFMERKRAEDDQLRLRKERESFLAILAHDLKTPLIAADQVLGALIHGQSGSLTGKQSEILTLVKKSNSELLEMIQEVLEVYRYSRGDQLLHKEPLNLRELIQQCIKTLLPVAKEKGAAIRFESTEPCPRIHADRSAARHLFMNLIWNGLKFTRAKGDIEISIEPESDDVVIRVKDSGEGIEQADLEKLFEPFWRGASGKLRAGGSGLGLYLCRQIVESHGGKIECASAVGVGTVFSITFPAC
jgi:PAS domain S-box-containing protein